MTIRLNVRDREIKKDSHLSLTAYLEMGLVVGYLRSSSKLVVTG